MRPEKVSVDVPQPQTRHDLQTWVREHLHLPAYLEASLFQAIDAVSSRHERVAQLLAEQVRSDDLLAQERQANSGRPPHGESRPAGQPLDAGAGGGTKDLHARFGGDEFCFLIPELADYPQAYAIGERFREAVE